MTIDITHNGTHVLNESDVCRIIAERDALAAALEDLTNSMAVEFEDERLRYVVVQVSRTAYYAALAIDPSAILAARLAEERKELINRIASTIRDYPNAGGDATIMAEVDKLVAAERKAGAVEERERVLKLVREHQHGGADVCCDAFLDCQLTRLAAQIERGEEKP